MGTNSPFHAPLSDSLRNPTPLLDKEGRIFLVLAGRPDDPSYLAAADDAHDLLAREGRTANFRPDTTSHRRGDFPVLNVGVTHGMGTGRPVYLDNGPYIAVVDRLLAGQSIQRLAVFASGRPPHPLAAYSFLNSSTRL